MHAQLTYFDGPRSPELVAAGDRGNRERIRPAIEAAGLDGELVTNYTLRQPDGAEVIIITTTDAGLDRGQTGCPGQRAPAG